MKNYNPRLLLIYNSEEEVNEFDNYFKKFNFTNIVGTNNLATAAKFCEVNKVDVILSNLEINNYCVVKRLLERRVLAGIPIIFYTYKTEDFRKYSDTKELPSNIHVKVLLNPTVDNVLNNLIVKLFQLKISDKFRNSLLAKNKLGQMEKINYADINFVESVIAHCKIHTKWGVYKTSGSLAKLFKNLNKNFIKVHEKYIVNITNVSNFSSTEVVVDGVRIPFTKTKRTALKVKLQTEKANNGINSTKENQLFKSLDY